MRGLVAPVVRDLRAAHPDLTLSLTEREPWDTIDLVATGQSDLGVVHRWGDVPIAIPDHLEATQVAHDVADVIVPLDHPLADRARVSPRDLVDEGWIATPEGTICRQWLTRMYAGTGRLPRIAHTAMEFDSHLALVRAGLGIALVPRLGRQPLGDELVAVPAHDPEPTRDVIAVHRRSMAESPAVRRCWRPPLTVRLRASWRAVTGGPTRSGSEQRRRQALPALEHPRVVVADGAEEPEQVLARLVALVAGRTADQLDQPDERVLHVAAEHVEVGDQRLGVDVVGVRGARRPGRR